MNNNRRLVIFSLLGACCLAAFGEDVAAPAATPAVPREPALAAQAFAAGDYASAWDYFDMVRKSAAPDSGMLDYAYRGLFSCALELRDAVRMEQLLQDFDRAYPNRKDLLRRFMGAELDLLRQKPAEAEAVLDQLAKGEAIPAPLYFQLLSEQGRAKLALNKNAEAADIYALLARTSTDPAVAARALRHQVYALIKAGNLTRSGEILTRELGRTDLDAASVREFTLLKLLQMIYERKFSEFDAAYAALPRPEVGGGDELLYEIASLAAENHSRNKRTAEAVSYWQDAFKAAPTEEWRRAAGRRIINTQIEAGQLEAALASLTTYLGLYRSIASEDDMRLLEPRLLARLKRTDAALAQYETLLNDEKFSAAEWRQAAKESAVLYREQKKTGDALRVLQALLSRSTEVDDRQEAEYLLAEHYYAVGDWDNAAQAFQKLAASAGQYRMRSHYWALRALLEQKNWHEAAKEADFLAKTPDAPPSLSAAACYYQGYILEQLDQNEAAMKAYDAGANRFPHSEYAAGARFQAAELAWEMGRYAQAAAGFAAVPEAAPAEERATDDAAVRDFASLSANALYRAVQSACFADETEAMSDYLERLKAQYPASPYTAGALFWQADYLKSLESFDLALAALQEMADFYAEPQPERLPAIWYDQAEVNARLGRVADALNVLHRLTEQYPRDPLVADSWFLAGDLLSKDGKYQEARSAYSNALTAHPEGNFALATQGRLGDCSYELYAQHRREDDLKLAQLYYETILENTELPPAMMAQTLYKLGRTLEAAKDNAGALDIYSRLLYQAAEQAVSGGIPGEAWVARGGYAAIKLCLNLNQPDAARRALAIIKVVESLNLPTQEDFNALKKAVREKYRI